MYRDVELNLFEWLASETYVERPIPRLAHTYITPTHGHVTQRLELLSVLGLHWKHDLNLNDLDVHMHYCKMRCKEMLQIVVVGRLQVIVVTIN